MSEEKKIISKVATAIKTGSKELLTNVKEAVIKPSSSIKKERYVTLSNGKSFDKQVTRENTVYVLKYDFNLGGASVTLPKGCTLDFRGGTLSDGLIVGSDSTILADRKVFYDVKVDGTWNCVGDVRWFAEGTPVIDDQWGCRFGSLIDQSGDIQKALDSSFRELHFPPSCYYITKTLILRREKRLVLHGSMMKLSLRQSAAAKKNTCIIFSDNDITLLQIAVSESSQNAISIDGGSWDVSLCNNYTQNCFEVLASKVGQRIWGLNINTLVKGNHENPSGTGISINPSEAKGLTGNVAYITDVRINSKVFSFGTGIKAMNYMDAAGYYYNWCTDIIVDGSIINCPMAVYTNVEDADIRATLQAGYFFDGKENDRALVHYTGVRGAMCSAIYDIEHCLSGKWSNQYAIELTTPNATMEFYGRFEAFRKQGLNIKKNCVKRI